MGAQTRSRRGVLVWAFVGLVSTGVVSQLSAAPFRRGDTDSSGGLEITDAVRILGFLFVGNPAALDCEAAADADDSGEILLTDGLVILDFLFRRGGPPAAPYPECGDDPSPDGVTCETYSACRLEPSTSLERTSPGTAERDVALTRETILIFTAPLDAGSVPARSESTTAAIFAEQGGQVLPGRLHLSRDGRTLTLFYDETLPPSARVRVHVRGDVLLDSAGRAVDADGDGSPGGRRTFDFDTLALVALPGTVAFGRVLASELAETPEGEAVNVPLAGVVITVDGEGTTEGLHAVTDENGSFRLDPAPVGRFFVHIDGHMAPTAFLPDGRTTETSFPDGNYYPSVGKTWETTAGQETDIGDVFLPLIRAGSLQSASMASDTEVGLPPAVISENPEFAGTMVLVPRDSLYADDGRRGGKVGIAPVAPDRLPGPLPPGLEFPIVVTVQTDGATNFDVPAPVCFPNLPDPATGNSLLPGQQGWLYSFNHDTGAFEPVGSMTASDDGRLVCSDPGTGILAPGWHGSGPPPWEPPPPCECACEAGGGGGGAAEEPMSLADGGGSQIVGPRKRERPLDPCTKKKNRKDCIACCDSAVVSDFFTALGGGSWAGVVHAQSKFLQCKKDCACQFPEIGGGGAGAGEILSFHPLIAALEEALTEPLDPTLRQLAELFLEVEELTYPFLITGDVIPAAIQAQVDQLETQAIAIVEGDPVLFLQDVALATELEFLGDVDDNAPPYPVRYAATIDRGGESLILRGETQPFGQYGVFVPGDGTLLSVHFFDPVTSSFGIAYPRRSTALAFELGPMVLSPLDEVGRDFDEDALADLAEFVLGSDPANPDSDGDGVFDGAEVEQGTSPVDSRATTIGVIATAETPGVAIDVCVAGDLVFVADGERGLSVFSVFQRMDPLVIAQVDTPGVARGLDASGGLDPSGRVGLVVIADGPAGLTVVDISDPPAARIVLQVPLDSGEAQAVAATDEVAWVGTDGGFVHVVALRTGAVLESRNLRGPVQDLAIEGSTLYAYTPGKLSILPLEQGVLRVASAAEFLAFTSQFDRMRLFVGDGLAYAVHRQGLNVIDVTDEAMPLVHVYPPTSQFGWKHLVPDGSGAALAAASENSTLDADHDVWLYDFDDPTDTTRSVDVAAIDGSPRFVTAISTPGVTRALAINNGLAYAADHENGLQVINFRLRDTAGIAPVVSFRSFPGGATLPEGALVRMAVDVTDDVQVRDVDLILGGDVVQTDGSFPFEFAFRAPLLAEQEQVVVSVRASDTGGNRAVTPERIFIVTPDTTPPQVVGTIPGPGRLGFEVSALSMIFDEDVMVAGGTLAGVTSLEFLGADGRLGGGDDTMVPVREVALPTRRRVLVELDGPLSAGNYQLRIEAGALSDAVGNLTAIPLTLFFGSAPQPDPGTLRWTPFEGGEWNDPENWSDETLPLTTDDVVIRRLGADLTIAHTAGLARFRNLDLQGNLEITGGMFRFSGEVVVEGDVVIRDGGTLFAQGADASFHATGEVTIDGGNVQAVGGAHISLPRVTRYEHGATESFVTRVLSAEGAGSFLDLSRVEVITGSALPGANLRLEARGGGRLDLSGVTELAQRSRRIILQALTGGELLIGQLTDGSDLTFLFNGAGTMTTRQMTTLEGASLTFESGGSTDFSSVTHLDTADVFVRSGSMGSFPAVTSYAQAATESFVARFLQSEGEGSRLDLSAVTTLAGTDVAGSTLRLEAQRGGRLDLSGVVKISNRSHQLTLASRTGGTFLIGQLTDGGNLAFVFDGESGMTTEQLTDLEGAGLTLGNGSSPSFLNVTNLDTADVRVRSGANVAFPSVTSYTHATTETFAARFLRAEGAASRLDLSAVTSISGSELSGSILRLEAVGGSTLDLSAASTLSKTIGVLANGAGSSVDLSSMVSPGPQVTFEEVSDGAILRP